MNSVLDHQRDEEDFNMKSWYSAIQEIQWNEFLNDLAEVNLKLDEAYTKRFAQFFVTHKTYHSFTPEARAQIAKVWEEKRTKFTLWQEE